MCSALSFLRPKKSAFWMTMRAAKSAAWVNFHSMQTSPAAKMRGLVVRRWSSTLAPRARVVLDADRLEAEPLDVRRAAGADQDLVDAQLVLAARMREKRSTLSAPSRRALHHLGGQDQPDALAQERALHDLGGVGVLAVEDVLRLSLSSVTSQPRRRNACASSQPIGPAPITARRRGRSVSEKTVSLVR